MPYFLWWLGYCAVYLIVKTLNNCNVSVGPSSVTMLGMKQSVSAGVKYNVQCQIVGARPKPKVTWLLNGQETRLREKQQSSPDGNVTISTIELTPDKQDDGSILTCKAGLDNIQEENIATLKSLNG